MPTTTPTAANVAEPRAFVPIVRYRTQQGAAHVWRGRPESSWEDAARVARGMVALETSSAHPWAVEWVGVEEVV